MNASFFCLQIGPDAERFQQRDALTAVFSEERHAAAYTINTFTIASRKHAEKWGDCHSKRTVIAIYLREYVL